jgi:serine/threonine-protein kinase
MAEIKKAPENGHRPANGKDGISNEIRRLKDSADAPLLDPDPFVGREIETKHHKYSITKLIGSGGMAKVYKASEGDSIFAVKITPPITSNSDDSNDFFERFKREANTLGMINNPHVVKVFGGGRIPEDGNRVRLYMVMQYVEGKPLSEIGKVDWRIAKQIALDCCDGLAAAHNCNLPILHRDVKPSNIRVRETVEGVHATLIDFGVAKFMDIPSVTIAGKIIGTWRYASPEQVVSGKKMDGRSDIYSLGNVIYFMLTGTPPFQQETLEELCEAIRKEEPEPPSKRAPERGIPKEVDDLVMMMLEKNPGKRPQRAEEVSDLLLRCTWDGIPQER